jgi:uncharacterized membrane protein
MNGNARTGHLAAGNLDSATVTSPAGRAGSPAGPPVPSGPAAGPAADPAVDGEAPSHKPAPPSPSSHGTESAAVVVGAAAVVCQIAYPLLTGTALGAVTVAAVLLFAAASLVHAGAWFGARGCLALVVGAGCLGLAAEAVGLATGLPFGRYTYSGTLGPQVLGVPLLVPLAWTMMAYPALLAARRLSGCAGHPSGRIRTALLGGLTLAAWDLFLDPQLVAAGHWTWADPSPSLPGVPAVPLLNTAGWLLVGSLMTAALDRLLPRPAASPVSAEALPAALLLWTWLGSVVANLVFFGRPSVALLGGTGMALTAIPYLRALLRARAQQQGAGAR